ncbi:MAG: putative manganese-dependent inorganic diphosphatase [Erysipelotrichaceae bacterium]|nr:putative manganese-dependent inorganic diphosphatase [Erysipelotrichaceae bacterium]
MAKNTIYVTGHKNPDTDSIVSAMAYAYLKQQLGYDAVAVRIGHLNQETEFILNLFNEFAPPYVRDIRTRVRDIDFDDVVTCRQDTNLDEALRLMKDAKKKVIAVLDEENDLVGMATISDISKPLIDDEVGTAKIIGAINIGCLAAFLNAELLHQGSQPRSNGQIILAMSAKTLDQDCRDRIVITTDNAELQKKAISGGAAVLMLAEGARPSEEILVLAQKHGCSVIVSDLSGYRLAQRIYYAAPISMIMSTKLKIFRCDDYIDDVKQVINKSRFRSYPVLDSRNHVVGMLSRYHLFKHASRNLILVDHNELSQSIEGVEEASVLEIIDHHRLGGIKTAGPITVRFERVGCCATIITEMFREKEVEIPEDLAGLLCCAIISDTVNFHSVTCTKKDIDTAGYLAELGNIDLDDLGPKILAAGASLSNRSCHAIFHNDLKIFMVSRTQVAVAQSNVVDFESALVIRDEMKKLMKNYAQDSGCGIVMMSFTLIDGSGSYVLSEGREVRRISEMLRKNGSEVDGFTFLPGVISRKQQIIPMITDALEEA